MTNKDTKADNKDIKKRVESTVGIRDESAAADRCIHCGKPFNPAFSTGGIYGICQDCIDD